MFRICEWKSHNILRNSPVSPGVYKSVAKVTASDTGYWIRPDFVEAHYLIYWVPLILKWTSCVVSYRNTLLSLAYQKKKKNARENINTTPWPPRSCVYSTFGRLVAFWLDNCPLVFFKIVRLIFSVTVNEQKTVYFFSKLIRSTCSSVFVMLQ